MVRRPLTVAWISFFPIEWLPVVPEAMRRLPRQHPAPWQRILADELRHVPGLHLHIISVRKEFDLIPMESIFHSLAWLGSS